MDRCAGPAALKIPGDELGGSDYLQARSAEDVVGVGDCFFRTSLNTIIYHHAYPVKERKYLRRDRERAFGISRVFINGHQVLSGAQLDKEALKTSGHAVRV